jgi:hypothetical protein
LADPPYVAACFPRCLFGATSKPISTISEKYAIKPYFLHNEKAESNNVWSNYRPVGYDSVYVVGLLDARKPHMQIAFIQYMRKWPKIEKVPYIHSYNDVL